MEVGNFHYKAKQVIFQEGKAATKLYKIESGEVLCVKWVKDRLIPIMKAKKGDRIGESAMIPGSKYNYSAIALTFTETDHLYALTFQTEFKKCPIWMPRLIEIMAGRFNHTADLIAENRIIHSSVISEQEFSPALENELKKLLA